jgi:hypothetical protein
MGKNLGDRPPGVLIRIPIAVILTTAIIEIARRQASTVRNPTPTKSVKKIPFVILCLALISSLHAAEPGQLELARKVIKATQFDRVFDQMGAQMQQMAMQSMNQSAPNQTPAQKEAATKVLDEIMKLSMDSAKAMLEKVDVIYAEVYSEAELKAMLTFFDSPEGKSMLQKQPQVMQHMMPLVQGMQKELMPKIQQIVQKAKAEADAAATTATPVPAPAPLPTPAPQK